MKKFFIILLKTIGVILLIIIALFITLDVIQGPKDHYGEWTVVQHNGKNLPENAKITYYLFMDDWGCLEAIVNRQIQKLENFKFKREKEQLLVKGTGKEDFTIYDINIYENGDDKYMRLKAGEEDFLLKFNSRQTVSGFYNKKSIQELIYNPVIIETAGTEIQLFANGLFFWDGGYGFYSYKQGSSSIYELLELNGEKFAEMDFRDIDNRKITLYQNGDNITLNVIPKKDYLNGKPSQTNIKTQTQREADLKSQRVEFAKKAILGRIQNNMDEWSGIDLDDYLIYLLSKWKRDAIELYGTENNIFNDGIWHIGYDHWDEQLTFKQEKECSRKLNGENTKMYLLRFDLSYGGKLLGSKEIIIYSTGKMVDGEISFKVYDICTDEASSGYWTREELKKYYRDELVREGMYKD